MPKHIHTTEEKEIVITLQNTKKPRRHYCGVCGTDITIIRSHDCISFGTGKDLFPTDIRAFLKKLP